MRLSIFKERRLQLHNFIPILLILFIILLTPHSSIAASDDEKQTLLEKFSKKVKVLQEKVKSLERGHARLYHSLEEKKSVGKGTKITENIKIGALVEVEASADNNDKDGDTSDLVLATFQLALDADINENVTGHVQLLYEEDTTDPIEVDEGIINISSPSGFNLAVGKMYLPFGVFNSHFISNPQVLDLAETNESALIVSYAKEAWEGSLGIFNGSIDEANEDDTIADFFLSVSYEPIEGAIIGGSYISDIGDSNGMTALLTSPLTDIVSGWAGFISLEIDGITIDAEYITSSERFNVADLDEDGDNTGDRPRAYNIEVGMPVSEGLEAAVKLEGNKDFFGAPETQFGVALSYGLYENVSLSAELLTGEYENNQDRTLITTQLGIEF